MNTLIFSTRIVKSDLEQIFVGSDFMTGGVPYRVGKRDQARSNIAHMDSERRLQDRIKQLEEENSDLKKKIPKFENAFLTAMDLLMKNCKPTF